MLSTTSGKTPGIASSGSWGRRWPIILSSWSKIPLKKLSKREHAQNTCVWFATSSPHFLQHALVWLESILERIEEQGSKESVNYFPLQQSFNALCAPILKYINGCLWLGMFHRNNEYAEQTNMKDIILICGALGTYSLGKWWVETSGLSD